MALNQDPDLRASCRTCLATNRANKPSPDILSDDYPVKGMLVFSLSILLIGPGYSFCMWGLLPHAFLGLIALIIGPNCMWLVYLRMGTLRNIKSFLALCGLPSFTFCWWSKNVPAHLSKLMSCTTGSPLSLPSGLLSSSSLGGGTSSLLPPPPPPPISAPPWVQPISPAPIPSSVPQAPSASAPTLSRSKENPSLDWNHPLQTSPMMPQVKNGNGEQTDWLKWTQVQQNGYLS